MFNKTIRHVQSSARLEVFSLVGKRALVTGASRGIGARIALALADAGADIIITGRTEGSLKDVAKEISRKDRDVGVLTFDVSDEASIIDGFNTLRKDTHIDILVNNAGVEQVCDSVDVDAQLWSKIIDTNLRGAFVCCQEFAKDALANNRPGSIINMCSLTSSVGVPTAAPYTASKSGLLGLTRALSAEWASRGVRVNAIAPGYFETALTADFYKDKNWREAMLDKIPMKRFGALDDLAGIAVFFASDASAYVTGQMLTVDGGYLASI